MNFKEQKSWEKHFDFIIIDLLCLQLAFLFAYWTRHGVNSPYEISIYRNISLVLILVQLMVSIFGENFKNVIQRDFYREFISTFKQSIVVTLMSTFYLFILKDSIYSRMTLILTGVFYLLISCMMRHVWKLIVRAGNKSRTKSKSLLIITTSERAEEVVTTIREENCCEYVITGLVLIDCDWVGKTIAGMEVIANMENVVSYVCRSWVDELYIDIKNVEELSKDVWNAFNEMGITVHLKLYGLENPFHRKQYVEELLGITVMTSSVNDISSMSIFVKRLIDIIGSILGCLVTLILVVILGPIIYISSPGPIFFSQTRVGQNGKYFKMYKFRSMYMDAEERKKELLAQNECVDGMMFKMKNDPRIIKGIGNFIRKTSLDEFPQFFNVLKGDMSLVGTRPPTVEEWEQYSLRHRIRMVMRPGITGMWQVSGRSDIKEFDDVVKLDAEYIAKWNIGLDIKIIIKTIGAVIKCSGAR